MYNTPIDALDALFKEVDFLKTSTYFEPCAGKGVIADYLRSKGLYVVTNELFDHGFVSEYSNDFLSPDTPEQWEFDCIISNPPYKIAKEFILKGFEVAKEQYQLLRLQFLEGQKRYSELFAQKHLKNIYVLTYRISCTEGVNEEETANSVNYAWLHFDRDYSGQPKLHWLT